MLQIVLWKLIILFLLSVWTLRMLVTRGVTLEKERIKIGTKMREDSKESETIENVIQVPNHDYSVLPDSEERGFNLQSDSELHNNLPVIANVLTSPHNAMLLTVVTLTICFHWFLLAFLKYQQHVSCGFGYFLFNETQLYLIACIILGFVFECTFWLVSECIKIVVKRGMWLLYMRNVFSPHRFFLFFLIAVHYCVLILF